MKPFYTYAPPVAERICMEYMQLLAQSGFDDLNHTEFLTDEDGGII